MQAAAPGSPAAAALHDGDAGENREPWVLIAKKGKVLGYVAESKLHKLN